MKKLTFYQIMAISALLAVISIALWICHLDYKAAKIAHSEVFIALLAIAYLAHLILKLSFYNYKDVNLYLWVTRVKIISLSLVPIIKLLINQPAKVTQEASFLDVDMILPFIMLAVIEGLLIVYCYIFKKKRTKYPRNQKSYKVEH